MKDISLEGLMTTDMDLLIRKAPESKIHDVPNTENIPIEKDVGILSKDDWEENVNNVKETLRVTPILDQALQNLLRVVDTKNG